MNKPDRISRPRVLYAVACLGLLVALALPSVSVISARQNHAKAVESRANSLRTALQLRLSLIETQLSGAAGFLSAVRHVEPTTYAEFMQKTAHTHFGRNFRAVAFMPAMERRDRALADRYLDANSASYAAEGYPPFSVFPATESEAFFPVLLVEPAAAREQVFGFDLASSPERLRRAQQALETGEVTLTDPLTLSQDSDGAPVSLLLIAPVTIAAGAMDHSALPSAQGVVAVGLTPVHILSGLLSKSERKALRAEVRIGPEPHPGLRFDQIDHDTSRERGFFRQMIRAAPAPILFGGRILWLDYAEVEGLSFREITTAAALFLLSLMAAGLGVAYIWRQMQVADEIAARLTQQEEELRQSGRMIAQAQKQEALGNLVGGVAHDFNNLLAVILGNAEFLEEPVSAVERDECVRQIKMATERGGSLSRQLLSFGRRAMLEPGRQDVGGFMHDLEAMLRRVLPESITLSCLVGPGTPPIFIDRNQLDTAVLNLAINARDAMPNGGTLTIEARSVMLGADFAEDSDEELTPGAYVMLSVRDTGHGMSDELAAQAFDPFFTTKPVGQGSGLGLSMVMGFVRQSGGTLRLASEEGRGTSVQLYFMALEPGLERVAQGAEETTSMEKLHVLLCEDEAAVRQVLKRQLVSAGYRVTCAPDGETALRKLQEGVVPDVLLSDVVMPGSVQGPDLVAAALGILPGLRTILISGYPRDTESAADALPSDTVILQKPLKKADLLAAIEALANSGIKAEAAE